MNTMEDGVSGENNNWVKMGATGNPNAARLATLQERKKNIEESLAKCNQQLRQLCIQEADLTGTVPQEMPLEPGESPPLIRRRVGTAYQLPENLIKNANATNKDESLSDLELQIQLHANLAEAALGLANEQHISKTLRREHMKEYQQHKKQFNELQEKLSFVKDNKPQQQQQPQQFAPAEQIYKQKKKQPRPAEQDDNISINASTTSNSTTNETFVKSELRQSIRSSKCSVVNDSGEIDQQQRYSTVSYPKDGYKDQQQSVIYLDNSYPRLPTAETLATGVYRLSINGYKNYMERRENLNNSHISTYNAHQHNMLQQYSNTIQHPQQQYQMPHYQQQQQQAPLQNNSNNPVHTRAYTAVQQVYSNNNNYPSTNPHFNQFQPDYNKYGVINNHQAPTSQSNIQLIRQQQPSPNHHFQQGGSANNSQQKLQQYYYTHNPHHSPSYRYSTVGAATTTTTNEQNYQHHVVQNPHQIQPHQQYDHSVMAGLGGYWKKNDNGEAVWCHYNTVDSGWPRDKRFGSLDRRKNKRIHKRVSPSADNKCATLASVPTYTDHVRTASIKSPQVLNRRSQDNRQLIRTQSLGSVGAQTTDSVWPSDDNSSCESDNRSINSTNDGVCKQKKREWLETSLDGPVSPPTPTHSVISRCQSVIPSILSPEEKYISPAQHNNLPPSPLTHTPKPAFEIPAESNPSPRISDTSNIELFNNNIPKNCTVVQAGHCKPYHEETKPFEMSDFYKYSTKFKKSPVKQQQQQQQTGHPPQLDENRISTTMPARTFHKNLNETSFDEPSTSPQGSAIYHSTRNHSFSSSSVNMSPAHIDNSTSSLNSSLDLSHIANANVAEHFSDEMNTWFKDQKFQADNNTNSTGGSSSTSSKGKSTATLV